MRQEIARLRPRPYRNVLLLLGLLAGLLALPRSGAAETRIALVIGNAAYRNTAPLANPVADARMMAETLAAAGFELIGGGPQLDLDKAGLERAIRAFGRRLARDAVGLFYYAGHGIQVNGANYLVPVDANLTGPADVKYELVDAGFVVDEMTAAGSRLNLMILDACRNNPFAARGLRGIGRGLAQVTAPAGTLIGYATQPGEVAADGDGANSPYTAALVQAISRPGLAIFDTFNSVGIAVKASTGGRQQPWLASSPIEGQFFFTPPRADGPPAAEAVPRPSPVRPAEPPQPSERIAQTPSLPAVVPPLPAAPVASAGVTLELCPSNFASIPAHVTSLTCGCPVTAMRADAVQGDNPYTPISNICSAALHAGALTPAGGQVTVTPVRDVPFFPNVRRNGINSLGSSGGNGFRVALPGAAAWSDPIRADGAVALELCPINFSSIPARVTSLTCGCPVTAMRADAVQGDNPYTPISNICSAALHAGALTPAGGQVTVTPVRDVPFFPNVRRNGISSLGSSGGNGFRIETPPRDTRLDTAGRPVQQAIAPALKTAGVVQLYINFATDRAEPLPSSIPVLRELLAALRDSPGLAVELIGHTDSTGGAAHNQDLSERRAAAVLLWLAQNGTDRGRLRSAGRGMGEPLADNASEAGRALNRRVEVKAVR